MLKDKGKGLKKWNAKICGLRGKNQVKLSFKQGQKG